MSNPGKGLKTSMQSKEMREHPLFAEFDKWVVSAGMAFQTVHERIQTWRGWLAGHEHGKATSLKEAEIEQLTKDEEPE